MKFNLLLKDQVHCLMTRSCCLLLVAAINGSKRVDFVEAVGYITIKFFLLLVVVVKKLKYVSQREDLKVKHIGCTQTLESTTHTYAGQPNSKPHTDRTYHFVNQKQCLCYCEKTKLQQSYFKNKLQFDKNLFKFTRIIYKHTHKIGRLKIKKNKYLANIYFCPADKLQASATKKLNKQ